MSCVFIICVIASGRQRNASQCWPFHQCSECRHYAAWREACLNILYWIRWRDLAVVLHVIERSESPLQHMQTATGWTVRPVYSPGCPAPGLGQWENHLIPPVARDCNICSRELVKRTLYCIPWSVALKEINAQLSPKWKYSLLISCLLHLQ